MDDREREAFEAWAADNVDKYEQLTEYELWLCWQARAALAASAAPTGRELQYEKALQRLADHNQGTKEQAAEFVAAVHLAGYERGLQHAGSAAPVKAELCKGCGKRASLTLFYCRECCEGIQAALRHD